MAVVREQGGPGGTPGEIDPIVDWLESNIGGTVRSISRQPRWRPVWFADVQRDGETLELVVRGERSDSELVFPLDHEMRVQHVMHEHGIPVPEVYGWMDRPAAFVMARVPGRPDFDQTTDRDRDVIVDEYVQALARLHTLDIEPFVEAAVERADRPENSGLIGMERLERVYRNQKNRPDPMMEFGLSWFHRHPPQSRGRERAVVWDSGQFHHHNGHFVSIVDLELGHLGDPMMDLAGWRMRDSVIPFGDFARIYDRYGALVGEPVDLEAIQLHHFGFTLSNQLGFSHTLRQPTPGADFMTNLQWCNETNIYVTEFLGEYLDIELPTVETPDRSTRQVSAAHRHLVSSLRNLQMDDDYGRYEVRTLFRLSRHLERFLEIGDALEQADLDDLEHLFGDRPASWLEGEEELERFVLADAEEGSQDEQLVKLFHQRNLRAQLLNGPAGSAMSRHNPIQSFHS
jgi:aminoglycoside phosphotransferase (APT) family kinase protein